MGGASPGSSGCCSMLGRRMHARRMMRLDAAGCPAAHQLHNPRGLAQPTPLLPTCLNDALMPSRASARGSPGLGLLQLALPLLLACRASASEGPAVLPLHSRALAQAQQPYCL